MPPFLELGQALSGLLLQGIFTITRLPPLFPSPEQQTLVTLDFFLLGSPPSEDSIGVKTR